MFKLFKKDAEKTNHSAVVKEKTEMKKTHNNVDAGEEKKKVHGEDGVCCGGCGGQ